MVEVIAGIGGHQPASTWMNCPPAKYAGTLS